MYLNLYILKNALQMASYILFGRLNHGPSHSTPSLCKLEIVAIGFSILGKREEMHLSEPYDHSTGSHGDSAFVTKRKILRVEFDEYKYKYNSLIHSFQHGLTSQ